MHSYFIIFFITNNNKFILNKKKIKTFSFIIIIYFSLFSFCEKQYFSIFRIRFFTITDLEFVFFVGEILDKHSIKTKTFYIHREIVQVFGNLFGEVEFK